MSEMIEASRVLSYDTDTNVAELEMVDGQYGIFMSLAPREEPGGLLQEPYLSLIARHDATRCGGELGYAHRLFLPPDVVDYYLTAIGDPEVAMPQHVWDGLSRAAYALHVASQMAIANGYRPGAEASAIPPSAE